MTRAEEEVLGLSDKGRGGPWVQQGQGISELAKNLELFFRPVNGPLVVAS